MQKIFIFYQFLIGYFQRKQAHVTNGGTYSVSIFNSYRKSRRCVLNIHEPKIDA
jgi:hypothetical protein